MPVRKPEIETVHQPDLLDEAVQNWSYLAYLARKAPSLYPYSPRERGIPFTQIFAQALGQFRTAPRLVAEGTIIGGSGRSLAYTLARNCLKVNDAKVHDLLLHTQLGKTLQDSDSIRFMLYSRPEARVAVDLNFLTVSGHHPDLFAARFIDLSLAYFKAQGVEVEFCQGFWFSGETNYAQFSQGLGRGLSNSEAARQTWSGRQFVRHGFSRVVRATLSEENELPRVSALFQR
jgi:hypothetical protein